MPANDKPQTEFAPPGTGPAPKGVSGELGLGPSSGVVVVYATFPGRQAALDCGRLLVEAGLAGIETFYPEHSAAQIQAYRETCRRLGLVATGGSDYHGSHTGRASTLGSPPIPLEVWENLKRKAQELRDQ